MSEVRVDINDKKELLKDLIKHPGAKIFVDLLKTLADKSKLKQLTLDPYSQPDEIQRCKQLVYLIEEELPKIIESIVNYDEQAIDKLVAPKRRWYFWKFFTR